MAWTKEQMQCIEPKNGIHNILVSAGAGAGKTATLVEKIIRGITTDEHSMGINEILCVTFTREAAREMKERISLALEKMLREHPNNMILSILVYTFFSRMFDLMLPPVAKHSIVVA